MIEKDIIKCVFSSKTINCLPVSIEQINVVGGKKLLCGSLKGLGEIRE